MIAVLAAGAMVVSAAPGELRAGDSQRSAGGSGRGPAVRPTTVSPVVDPKSPSVPATKAVVRPPTATLLAPVAPAGVPGISAVGFSALAPVDLGAAGAFAILTKSGVTDVYASTIRGNVGASPITGAAIPLACSEVKGTIFSVDAAVTQPCRVTDASGLTAAVHDEEAAYTDAAGRKNPGFVNLGAGEIGGRTLAPGLYSWTTGVSISTDVTLAGGPNDVWIFQIAGALDEASAKRVILTGGAQARNVFWQTAGAVAIGTTAHFEGTILAKTMIAMNTGASTNGRLLAQTAVTLQKNTVTNVR
jgi:hypothetical protein